MQDQLREQFDRNKIARDRSIVANTQKTLSLMPSIIDYIIVNGEIRSTVAQWSDALTKSTDFREDIPTKTNSAMDALFEATNRLDAGDIFG
jgi:Asp-tRNA(Asn)/Glu-tRNA(Gln) amidotransferase C subunit